jgi:uncharacterized membrane protein YgcG
MSACAGILELLVDAEGIESVAGVFVDTFRAFRGELSGTRGRRKEDFNRICGELRKEGPPWKFFVIQLFCATSAVPAPDGLKIDLYGSTDRFVSYLLNYATVHMIESISIIRKATDTLKASIKDKLSTRYVESDEGFVQSVIELDSDSDSEKSAGSFEHESTAIGVPTAEVADYDEDFDSVQSALGPSHRKAVSLSEGPQSALGLPPQSGAANDEGSTIADDYSDDFAEPASSNDAGMGMNLTPGSEREGGGVGSSDAVPTRATALASRTDNQEKGKNEEEEDLEDEPDGYEDDFDSPSAAPPQLAAATASTAAISGTSQPQRVESVSATAGSVKAISEILQGCRRTQEDEVGSIALSLHSASASSTGMRTQTESDVGRAPMVPRTPQPTSPHSLTLVDKDGSVGPLLDHGKQRSELQAAATTGLIGGSAVHQKEPDNGDSESRSEDSSSSSSKSSSSSSGSGASSSSSGSSSKCCDRKEPFAVCSRPIDSQPMGGREISSGAILTESPSSKTVFSAARPVSAGPSAPGLMLLATGAVSDAPKFEPSKPRPASSPSKTRVYMESNAASIPTGNSNPTRGRPGTAGAMGAGRDSPLMIRQPKPGVPYQRHKKSSVRSTIDVAADVSNDFNRILDTSKVRVNNLNDLHELLQYKAFEAHKIVMDSSAIWQKKLEEALKSSSRPDVVSCFSKFRPI